LGGDARPRVSLQVSVAVNLDQAFVADPEVVGNLMEDDPAHLAEKLLGLVRAEPHKWAAVDRDLVWQYPCVMAAASGERHTLIKTE
jgi:hypothetical protein